MNTILVTGSAGLIGSEAVRFFCNKGCTVFGIDNKMRQVFLVPMLRRNGITIACSRIMVSTFSMAHCLSN